MGFYHSAASTIKIDFVTQKNKREIIWIRWACLLYKQKCFRVSFHLRIQVSRTKLKSETLILPVTKTPLSTDSGSQKIS